MLTMRRLMKFLHTMGAIGLMGSMACLLVLLGFMPEPASLSEYARLRAAMGGIAQWIFLPSLALTLIAGLAAIALNRSYDNAGWAWAKLMTGIWCSSSAFRPFRPRWSMKRRSARPPLPGDADAAAMLGQMLDAEWNSLWVLIAVAVANVVLGIWRPRLFPD
jgi:hypothetical protein